MICADLLAASGDLVCYCSSAEQQGLAKGTISLLKMRARHPALYLDSTRRRISTQDDSKFYSILRSSADRSERILAIFNFQPAAQTVRVDLEAIDAHDLTDLATNSQLDNVPAEFTLSLSAYAYHLDSIH